MRQKYSIAGTGLLCLCLAGYMAYAGGQLPPSVIPASPTYGGMQGDPRVVQAPDLLTPAPAPPVGNVARPDLPPEPISPPAPGLTAPTSVPLPALGQGPSPVLPPPPGTTPQLIPGSMLPATQAHRVSSPPTPALPPDEMNPVPSATADNPTGRQEPSVSIEWTGPPSAQIGRDCECGLVVRNTSNVTVHQVVARVRIPNGLQVEATEPKAVQEGGFLSWDLGTLTARQERNLKLKLQANTKGDLMPQAWLTFSATSTMRIRVREPKLVLKATSSEKVLVGDAVPFTLTVSNPGDGTAEQVKIQAILSEGLEHARGNKVDFDIGNLSAGETRSVQVICAARSGGLQKCEGLATSAGGALTSRDTASVNIIKPHLDVSILGPGLRYLERKAIYTLRVANPGDAPATNVTVSHVVPAGFKVLAASDGGRHDFSTRTVSWFLGEVGPGQTREVKVEVQAITAGEHRHKALAIGARGLRAESEATTRVEGLSAILIEMVDTEDPIEVNADTAYEIRVTNTGSQTENDIKLVATIPDKMAFKNAQGPMRYRVEGKTIIFEPLEKLAPRADAIIRLNVKGIAAGIVRFKMQVTSANLIEPVIKMEATRIYSDAPEGTGSVPQRMKAPVEPDTIQPEPGQPGGPVAPAFPVPPVIPTPRATSLPNPAPSLPPVGEPLFPGSALPGRP